MKKLIHSIWLILLTLSALPQSVFTSDIDHFWQAYDSVQTTPDTLQQLRFIQTIYVDAGTPGLKAFMEARNYSAPLWVRLLREYPKFWRSIRPNTLSVKSRAAAIEASIKTFRTIYPPLTDARMYFTVGGLRSGGTIKDNMILVGTEIATGDSATDVSEFTNGWLATAFRYQTIDNIVPLNVHEYVHTQQKFHGATDLLGASLSEGSADFITSLVIGRPMETSYIRYGLQHQPELKKEFAAEMFSTATVSRWLYNGRMTKTMADLGYFMGYQICAAYYRQAADKQQAVRDIIELNYTDTSTTASFLQRSGYLSGPFDRAALQAAIAPKIPAVTSQTPFANGDSLVDPVTKLLTIRFSVPIAGQEGYAVQPGPQGKDFFPALDSVVLSPDRSSLTLHLTLLPSHTYAFNVYVRSADGYQPNPFAITFKTLPPK
jgi:hypothetical protein